MTNKAQALGRRILGTLHNENIVIVVSTSTSSVTVVNVTTGKGIYTASTLCSDGTEYWTLIECIRSMPGYPAPKAREPRMVAKTHGAPKYVGNSMGRFVPGKLRASWE